MTEYSNQEMLEFVKETVTSKAFLDRFTQKVIIDGVNQEEAIWESFSETIEAQQKAGAMLLNDAHKMKQFADILLPSTYDMLRSGVTKVVPKEVYKLVAA